MTGQEIPARVADGAALPEAGDWAARRCGHLADRGGAVTADGAGKRA